MMEMNHYIEQPQITINLLEDTIPTTTVNISIYHFNFTFKLHLHFQFTISTGNIEINITETSTREIGTVEQLVLQTDIIKQLLLKQLVP